MFMRIQRYSALARETRRLRNYLKRNHFPEKKQLMAQGRYRSLCRRIANIKQWDMREIDLGQEHESRNGDWLIQAFAALDRSVFPQVAQYTREIRIIHRPQCVQLASMLLDGVELGGLPRMWKNWLQVQFGIRRSTIWQDLLIYLLDRKPSRALDFMRILVRDPLVKTRLEPPAFADALDHLSRLHLNEQYDTDPDWKTDPAANRVEFGPGFCYIYKRVLTQHYGSCTQDLLHNIAQLAEIQDLKKIFALLLKRQTRFGFDTLLHYAHAFAKGGELEYALRCLDTLSVAWSSGKGVEKTLNYGTWTEVVDRQRLRWTCALILRKTASLETDYRTTTRLVENFVGMGVKIDITLYNVVMHNAMEAGDYATAFKLYNSLEEHNLEPDAHTLGILLHGCTLQDNPARFSDFARHCKSVARETQGAWLATEYLHYLYTSQQEEPDVEIFSTMIWRAYLGMFDASALEPFVGFQRRQVRNRMEAQLDAGATLMEPTPMALYLMLQVEIKHAMSVGGYQQVLNLYHEFQVLARMGTHPTLTQLTSQPIVWNAFLLAFCQQEQFAAASELLRFMMEHGPSPNVYSWNILMQSFFNTGQVQAAERAYEIMRSRDVEPDPFTHLVLLRGYARAQLIDRVGESMQHLDAQHELDPQLLSLLSRILDRDKMIATLEASRLAKEAASEEAAAKEAEARAKRWSVPWYFDPDDEMALDSDKGLREGEEEEEGQGEQEQEDQEQEEEEEEEEEQTQTPKQQFVVPGWITAKR